MNREIKFRIGDKELKEGMYVRTAFGIKRICEINHKAEKWKYLYKLKKQDGDGCIDLGQLCDDDIINEPSFNVIDLIEVGDYVNGDLVTFISSNPQKNQKGKHRIILNDSYSLFGKYENIKSIVTKEQFESQKYIVESE